MLDLSQFEAVVKEGFFPVCIVGNPETKEFVLLDLAQEELSEATQREMTENMTFIGVAALTIDCKPRSALREPLESDATEALAQAYVRHVESSIQAFFGVQQTGNA
jgi:hypothetical protein